MCVLNILNILPINTNLKQESWTYIFECQGVEMSTNTFVSKVQNDIKQALITQHITGKKHKTSAMYGTKWSHHFNPTPRQIKKTCQTAIQLI